ncbi:hypothetical protein ACQEU8_01730 [Streptomyces sp. CA-250714]|uniref:hypothetical protein n=1 Tax=Streptomyces sp. CA-250714 TaxID=3240060 RepID=UPI003D943D8D
MISSSLPTKPTPRRSAGNQVIGGQHDTVVQAGSIAGDVHVHAPGNDEGKAIENPVIATVRAPGGAVVDTDPPRVMARGGHGHFVTLEARPTTRAVVLRALRPVIISRRPARKACLGRTTVPPPGPLGPVCAAPMRVWGFSTDLDAYPLRLTPLPGDPDFPFSISATDVEEFCVTPTARTEDEISWQLELDWTCAGRRGTTVVDNDGQPFELWPGARPSSDLDWGCGGEHRPGCPAQRLAAQAGQGVVGWFSHAEDRGVIFPDNEGSYMYFAGSVAAGFRAPLRGGQRVSFDARLTPTGLEVTALRPR